MIQRIFFLTPKTCLTEIARIVRYLKEHSNTVLRIEIAEQQDTRTNEQNAYLWGVVYPLILQRLEGWDAKDLHEYFLGEHYGWIPLGGLNRKRMKPARRSSRLSVKDFREHWQFIQREMALIGIDIPDPNEHLQEKAA